MHYGVLLKLGNETLELPALLYRNKPIYINVLKPDSKQAEHMELSDYALKRVNEFMNEYCKKYDCFNRAQTLYISTIFEGEATNDFKFEVVVPFIKRTQEVFLADFISFCMITAADFGWVTIYSARYTADRLSLTDTNELSLLYSLNMYTLLAWDIEQNTLALFHNAFHRRMYDGRVIRRGDRFYIIKSGQLTEIYRNQNVLPVTKKITYAFE